MSSEVGIMSIGAGERTSRDGREGVEWREGFEGREELDEETKRRGGSA